MKQIIKTGAVQLATMFIFLTNWRNLLSHGLEKAWATFDCISLSVFPRKTAKKEIDQSPLVKLNTV